MRDVVLASASAVAAVPYERVAAVLRAGPTAATAVVLGLDPASLGSTTVMVDEQAGVVTMEGELWYRGEYHLSPHANGTLVRHDVVNVSGRSDRMVAWWQRRFLRGVESDVAGFALALPHRVAASPY